MGDAPIPPNCDLSKEPKDSLACVDYSVGIFVSPTGSDADPGTKTRPVKTASKAIEIAGNRSRIYLCEGAYGEAVKIEGTISIYGGWSCTDWGYTGRRASITGPAGSITLSIRRASSITVADIDVAAPDAPTAGRSAIAALTANSTVVFRRTSLIAGSGRAAQDEQADGGSVAPGALDGNPGTAGTTPRGGDPKPNPLCSSVGGGGGAPADGSNPGGYPGGDGSPKYGDASRPPNNTGAGQTVADCRDSTGVIARPGSHGAGGTFGASASTYGALTVDGWSPAAGLAGGAGGIGQGGGGGASTKTTAGGGGGGAGGCGGKEGRGGAGGGSSIALAVLNSTVTIDGSTLAAHDGGKGGNGGGGQIAQAGGEGSLAGNASACGGGKGGAGGSGGGGGGGAGGLSVGILWSGQAPIVNGQPVQNAPTADGITVTVSGAGGTPGAGGAAVVSGALGGARASTPGVSGVAQAVVKI